MDPHEYHFASAWRLPAPPDAVFGVLAQLDRYPVWWPQVRAASPLDSDRCALAIRSVLPLTLRFVASNQRRDPVAGVLQAGLSGDIVGYSRWTLVEQEFGTAALFEERVELTHPLARRLSALRPALRANHALMMRRGEAGLRAHLAARAACDQPLPD